MRVIKTTSNADWRLSLSLVTSLALIVTIYTYSAQVTNASYQPSEYFKEPPRDVHRTNWKPLRLIKKLG